MANTLYPQLQLFTLYSSGASIGDTSLVLTSFQTIDEVSLAMTDFGDKGFLTLDPGSGTLEEQISFSGVTQNANGTATLTGVKHVGDLSPYTEVSGITKQHSGGSTCSVAITSGLLNQFVNKGNAETITGLYTFTNTSIPALDSYLAPTLDGEFAPKKYIDDIAIAGSPDASETVKGISELATGAECAAGTSSGGAGRLVVPASNCKKTSAGVGDANKVPVLGEDGLLDQTFLDKARTWALVQSFTADNAQITTAPDSANDAMRYVQAQLMSSTNEATGLSGVAIAIGKAIYLKASDEKLYLADSNADESTYSFVGFALTVATGADETIRYAKVGGIATGLSGLTPGSYYFLNSTAGAISVTPDSTRAAKIGQALSATTLRICEPKFIRRGVSNMSSATTFTETIGFYPVHIDIKAAPDVTGQAGGSVGDCSNRCISFELLGANNDAVDDASLAWRCYDKNASMLRNGGTVSAKSQTGFVLTCSTYVSTAKVQWVAYSG